MSGTAKRERSSSKAGSNQAQQVKHQGNEPGLDRVIQAQIGDKLRAMYGELVEQPVPDRLAAVLAQLSQDKR